MNHIYKVIWNQAKHCYTVVSEIAKSHSDGTKRIRTGAVAALLAVASLSGVAIPIEAAVTVDKDGTVKAEAEDISALNDLLKNGVTTAKDGSVTIGGMTVNKKGEVSINSPDVVYGQDAKIILDSNNATGQISIGKNAEVFAGSGGQEQSFSYDGNPDHAAGAIAIGSNTYARTGSIMIGSHVYKGNMGDVKDIDTDIFNTSQNGAYGLTVNSTTIGTNSFTKGNLATTIGDYNIQSGKSKGYGLDTFLYGAQNFGATILGALNSNESQSATIRGFGTSGVANSIVGVANRVNSSNGTLVFGAGNEVTNSLSSISGVGDTTSLRDATKAQETLKDAVAKSDAGGAMLAIGGANKADWAQKSQLIGVGNTLTGTEKNVSKYDMINGYKNEVSNATNTYIIGSNNKAKDIKSTTITGDDNDVTGSGNHIIGDNHKVTGTNNILIGNNKEQKIHSGNDAVIIGNNASGGNTALVMGNQAHAGNTGIALGMNASAGDGQNLAIGYYANVSGVRNSTALGYASKVEKRDILDIDGNDGVVSVGKSVGQSGEAGLTRRIINVKAGVNDTDAVNVSQLKKVSVASSTTVSDGTNTTVTSTVAEDGHRDYKVNLNQDLKDITSISNGDSKVTLNDMGIVISRGNDKTFSITDTGMGMSVIGDDYITRSIMVGKNGTVISGGLSVAGSKITNVAAGEADTDAVNVGQLKDAISKGNTDSHIKAGNYEVGKDNTVSMDVVDKEDKKVGTVTITDVAKASDVGDVSQIASDIKNKEGSTTVVDAVNNVNNKVGDLNYSQVGAGEIADGDNTTTAIGKLNQKLNNVEQTAGKHSSVSTEDSNLSISEGTNEAGGTDYKVSLNKDLTLDSVTTGDTKMDTNGVKVGETVSLTKNGLTAGDTKVTNSGLSIGDKTYVSKDGLNANNQKVTNVSAGDISADSKDAVNGSQLFATNQQVVQNAQSINKLGGRINKVGAGAAALAALHPLDFDPDDKWDFAAGYGNYNGENAMALGAYYRPNEDTMFSVGGSFGNGENMVNAGVSLKLGQGNHVSTSKVAMAKEIKDLRKELEVLKSALLDMHAGKKMDTSKLQLFPDVPKNHWAYEYVATLKGNGMLTGYPDGDFKGDRCMTRYEFATMLYNAMLEGATLPEQMLKEFAPELERFTVDTVHQDKQGKPTVERVRTVKADA